MGHSEQRKSASRQKCWNEYWITCQDELQMLYRFSPFLSLYLCTHLKPELVNKQRKELSSLDSVLGSIWLDLPCLASVHCGSNTSRSSQLVTSRLFIAPFCHVRKTLFSALRPIARLFVIESMETEAEGEREREGEREAATESALYFWGKIVKKVLKTKL